jgi:hypothetical protein
VFGSEQPLQTNSDTNDKTSSKASIDIDRDTKAASHSDRRTIRRNNSGKLDPCIFTPSKQ